MRFMPLAFALLAALSWSCAPLAAEDFKRETFNDAGFVSIFDGKTLDGWHTSAASGHSRASKNGGGRWVVEDGDHRQPGHSGNGGIVITDKPYGNFEVAANEQRLRARQRAVLQHREGPGLSVHDRLPRGRNLAGVYGERALGRRSPAEFRLHRQGDRNQAAQSIPPAVKPADWPAFWKHGQWNELRARIAGNPPKITTWINVRFMEFQDRQAALTRRRCTCKSGNGGDRLAVRPLSQHPRQIIGPLAPTRS